jgi:AcrR family transcriptional regulator
MTRRAKSVAETRLRITEAAVELHGSVGPARTTISAVAERAGVERLTVYRHFPDENALFRACTGHWLERHPFPDPGRWRAEADPEERLRRALGELYDWYGQTATMMGNFLRDASSVAALRERLEQWEAYTASVRDVLRRGWNVPPRRRAQLAAALGHAVDFDTWRSLRRHDLDGAASVELMTALACAAAGSATDGVRASAAAGSRRQR